MATINASVVSGNVIVPMYRLLMWANLGVMTPSRMAITRPQRAVIQFRGARRVQSIFESLFLSNVRRYLFVQDGTRTTFQRVFHRSFLLRNDQIGNCRLFPIRSNANRVRLTTHQRPINDWSGPFILRWGPSNHDVPRLNMLFTFPAFRANMVFCRCVFSVE